MNNPPAPQQLIRTAALSVYCVVFVAANANAAISFTQGHIYTTTYNGNSITEYDYNGNLVGSLGVGRETRGLTFGPDNLLYVTTIPDLFGFEVLAIDKQGVVKKSYASGSPYVNGNISYGKIAVDDSYIYVTGQNHLMRIDIDDPDSIQSIYSDNQIYDVEILPSGNLLVASAYDVHEITTEGTFIRNIEPSSSHYTDVRGVEYDPITNNVFVTHLGRSNFFFRIMRVDYDTGVLQQDEQFHHADDLFVTSQGDLLVGSRTQAPRLYNQELQQLRNIGSADQLFVTQYTIPEPNAIILAFLAFAYVGASRRSGSRPFDG